MGKILVGIIAVVASFMLVDSLTCNKCTYGLLGFCLSTSEEVCSSNSTDSCYTGKTTFTGISSVGFNTQGCTSNDNCNKTISPNTTIFGVSYQTVVECCSTDKCNPVTISGAPSNRVTLTSAIGAAILASVLGSML